MILWGSLFAIFLMLISSEAQIGIQFPSPRPSDCDGICKPGCPKIFCLHGSVKLNPCDCCPSCLKGSGAKCGGLNREFGVCAHDLICQTTVNALKIGLCQAPHDKVASASIHKPDLVQSIDNVDISDEIHDKPNSENNGYPGPDVPSACPPPICAVIRCASPDFLGCPNSFVTDPCECCPRCIYN